MLFYYVHTYYYLYNILEQYFLDPSLIYIAAHEGNHVTACIRMCTQNTFFLIKIENCNKNDCSPPNYRGNDV